MEWINIKDKIPEEFERVIAFCLIDIYSHQQKVVHEAQYMANGRFISLTKKDITVKYWMPLPKAPNV